MNQSLSLAAGLFHDLAIEEMNGPVGELGVARIMSDHADGGAFTVEFAQQFDHRLAVLGVQVPGGLIRQQNRRLAGQRASHGHTLLLTAGELGRIMLHAVRHPHPFQRLLYALFAFRGRHATVSQRQLHVFINVQIADEVEGLENETNLPVANPRALR